MISAGVLLLLALLAILRYSLTLLMALFRSSSDHLHDALLILSMIQGATSLGATGNTMILVDPLDGALSILSMILF